MMSRPGLIEKISGFTVEKIKRIIKQREKTHLKRLQEWQLINGDDSVEVITKRVLEVELSDSGWTKVTTEFLYVCWFVLDVDNPLTEELFVHLSNDGESLGQEWENFIKSTVDPTSFYKGKPYQDEKKTCFSDKNVKYCISPGSCTMCNDAKQQQKILREQIRRYFDFQNKKDSKIIDKSCEEYRDHVQFQQNESIKSWEEGEEYGGLFKGADWETAYVFGTEKMKRVLRKHLHDFNQWFSKTADNSQKGQECFTIRVSGGDSPKVTKISEGIGDEDKEKILAGLKELESKPLSESEVIRTLSRHSVGILSWHNRCQATVIGVGKGIVLSPAHIFNQDKSEMWDHLLFMYCDQMFPQSCDQEDVKKKAFCFLRQRYLNYWAKSKVNKQKTLGESFKEFIGTIMEENSEHNYTQGILLAVIQPLRGKQKESESVIKNMTEEFKNYEKIRREKLVNFHGEEMKIHVGYTDEAVKDHFKENCCRYFVKEVILLDYDLDFALLKVADSTAFEGTKDMLLRQTIVPMSLTSSRVSKGHVFVAAHPYGKTLSIESFVKLLADYEKSVFVENFTTQAILQAVNRSNESILRHVENAESVFQSIPVCVYMNKYEMDSDNILVKKSYDAGKITHSSGEIRTSYKKAFIFRKGGNIKEIPVNQNEKHFKQVGGGKVLVSTNELENGQWREYTLKEHVNSEIQRRGHLQIPIPLANREKSENESSTKQSKQNDKPYRFIITSKQERKSFACKITDASKLFIKKIDFIAVEESNGPILLSVVSEVRYIECKFAGGKFSWLRNIKVAGGDTGTHSWKNMKDTPTKDSDSFVVVRLDKPYHTPELSLRLQSDSKGNLSLYYHFRQERVKNDFERHFCLEKEEILETEIAIDEKETIERLKVSTKKKMALKGRKKRDAIRLEKQNSEKNWTGNIFVKRKQLNDGQTDRYLYFSLKVSLKRCEGEGDEGWDLSYTANKGSKRRWIYEDDPYVVWPTNSLSTNFELQLQNREKSQVTLSFLDTSNSYIFMELDLKEKRSLRQMDQSVSPTVFGFILYVEYKRLEKLVSADADIDTSKFAQALIGSNEEEVKNEIITKEIKTSCEKNYMKNEEFAHLKLIDMEYGASGGACCFLGNQGQILLHGMFLGACPSFYYNDEEIRQFFNRTGTCFNEILPSESLIKKFKDLSDEEGNVKLEAVKDRDDMFIFTELGSEE